MSKIKIKKDDKYRILLTEILPYEVPIIFSNEGFYSIVKNEKHKHLVYKIKDLLNQPYGIPFNFEIGKNFERDTRTLSVIHPYFQLNFVELYEKYNSLMIHLCSKSQIALRRISKVAKYFYTPSFVFKDEDGELKDEDVEVESDNFDETTKYIKSYFTYKPIDLIYKFYEKIEFRRFEQRFIYMMTFDISKCFYHIYTHSISWAIKDKESAKRNSREKSFENEFDKYMQKSNYNETNGIIVGPEISRIFAEIILQRIDVDAIKVLEEIHFIKFGIDYEVRRYVDDYFIFCNEYKNLLIIKEVFQDKLSHYKLYINNNKSDIITSPFISNIHVAKQEIKNLLYAFINKILIKNEEKDKNIKIKVNKPYKISQEFLSEFQCIAKRNNLTYDIVSKEVVRFFNKKVSKILKDINIIKNDINFENFLIAIMDIILYCYSMNICANTTFKVSQLIVIICKFFEKNNNNSSKHIVYSKIAKDVDNILTDNQRKNRKVINVDILNILIALKKLGTNYLLTEKRIENLFNLEEESNYDKLNYFQIITLLYYIENKHDYTKIRINIEKSIMRRFENDVDMFVKTEMVILFFDIICCPYINDKTKRNLINITKYCKKEERIEDKIKEINVFKKWFVDWNKNIDLERILKKKEWGSSY